MGKLESLLAEIEKLSPAERKQVEAHLLALRTQRTETLKDQLLYPVVVDVLREFSVTAPPFVAFKKTVHFKRFKEGSEIFHAFIDEHLRPKSQAEYRKAQLILLRMLARRAKIQRMGLSAATLSTLLSHVADVTDDQFPGYRASKVLPILLIRDFVQ